MACLLEATLTRCGGRSALRTFGSLEARRLSVCGSDFPEMKIPRSGLAGRGALHLVFDIVNGF